MSSTQLSVIIPTYNRPESLKRCLSSLKVQSADASTWEVIVVNDGGMDVTGAVEAIGAEYPILVLNQTNAGPASARNRGVGSSKGRLVAFIDDDCMAEPDWIERMMELTGPGELVGGKVSNLLTGNVYSETCQTLIDYLYERFENTSDMFFTSNNMCMHAADYEKAGGFDTGFRTSAGEDREFCVRAANTGIRLRWVPAIRIGHTHGLGLASFLRLHFKYGRASSTYRSTMEKNGMGKKTGFSIGFYTSLLHYPFKHNMRSPLRQAALLAVSQACILTGFLYERLSSGR
jgi:glycosyltransferase involved in cell wall biosynthesis